MSEQTLVNKLKQRGHWKVTINPTEYTENRFDFAELKATIEKCSVRLRGWDYPHIDHQNTYNRSGYIESYCEFGYHIEYWRLYRSGKFIHLFGMREDGREDSVVVDRFRWYAGRETRPQDLRGLSILSSIYSLTEIFEFGIRMGKHGVLNSGAHIAVELYGLRNRMLYFEEVGRDLRRAYICLDDYKKLEAEFGSPAQLIETGHAFAMNWFIEIAQQFQWDSPPKGILTEEQKKFLERRI
ncbi:MAG: hypothetical protein HY611_09195 [Elusimicrobia bacterium]|nr:hypothetical protein [Elusimicrobiota bacterium]